MKKTFSLLIAIMLCISVAASFTGCTATVEEEEPSDAFVAATIDTGDGLPSSTAEIIAFYNNIISSVQNDKTFTAENKPGVSTSEGLSVNNIKILSYDAKTGEATENEALASLNDSAKAIKDRILGKIETDNRAIAFGDTSTSISSIIYPFDSADSKLTVDNVVSAACSADGSNINISIILNNEEDTINNIFGSRNKTDVLEAMNKECADYATINDYTSEYVYVNTEDEKTYSTINLSVELEKQADGTYKSTGRITNFKIVVISDVKANLTCKGSFAYANDIQVQFRLTDEKNYSFDWLGTEGWETTK